MKLSQTNGTLLRTYGGDITKTLEHLKRCGFRYIDVSFFECFVRGSRYWTDGDEITDEYKRALDKLQLVPVQSHEPAGNIIGDDGGEYHAKKTSAAMKIASAIGVTKMVIHPGSRADLTDHDECIEENIKAIKNFMPVAEKYNMKLMLENMPEFYPMTADDLVTVVDGVGHELLGINWDAGHANIRGLDQYEEIMKLGDRLWGVHLHDNVGWVGKNQEMIRANYSGHYDLHMAPFYGNINYDAIMTALLDVGYKGTFNFEVDAPQVRTGQKPFVKDGVEIKRFGQQLPTELREQADKLMYGIGKYILQTYDCFEE